MASVRYIYKFVLILITTIAVIAILNSKTNAETDVSSWLKPNQPVFNVVSQDMPSDQVPKYNNKNCLPNTKFVTVPENILKAQAEQSVLTCPTQTAFGLQNTSDNLVKLNDTNIAGFMKSSVGSSLTLYPIPNSRNIAYTASASEGSYIYIVKDYAKNIDALPQSNGTLNYQLKTGVVGTIIRDVAGAVLPFADIKFSENGKWMVGDVPGRGMTRTNVETGETLTFGPAFNYSNGLKPKFVMAISSDGRYALVSESSYEVFKLYDLSTCVAPADPTKPANCQSRDLLTGIKASITNFYSLYHMDFSTNYTARLYAQYNGSDSKLHFGYYSMTAYGEKESRLDYLALGDSFASGEGAYNYKAYTDVQDPFNKCHLSLASYPYLLKNRTNINSGESVTCSGAKLKDLVYSDPVRNYATDDSQSKGKSSSSFDQDILNGFLVGYRTQNDFVDKYKPSKVTVSISGNDIGFGNILKACLMPGTCYKTPQEKIDLAYTISAKFDDIAATYIRIKQTASSNSTIYALGYPQLAFPEGNCAINVQLDRTELNFANQVVSNLNSTIKAAANKSGVVYVDVEHALDGHRLCEATSKNIAINGLTVGSNKTFTIPLKLVDQSLDIYLTGRESYHPNELGHRLLAEKIFQATNGLTALSTPPILSSTQPNYKSSDLLIGVSTSIGPRKIIPSESISNNVLIMGAPNDIKLSALKPSSTVNITLRSTNLTSIASIATDTSGSIVSSINVPSLAPGFYMLDVAAKNFANEDIVLQKTVYVAKSQLGLNGNDLPNSQESCIFVPDSGSDLDKDGKDDACDGLIGEPPLIVDNTPSDNVNLFSATSADQNTNNARTATSLVSGDKKPNDDTGLRVSPSSQESYVLGSDVVSSYPTSNLRSSDSYLKPVDQAKRSNSRNSARISHISEVLRWLIVLYLGLVLLILLTYILSRWWRKKK